MNREFFEKGSDYLRRHFIHLNDAKIRILNSPTVSSVHQIRTNSRRLKSSLLFYKKFIKKNKFQEYINPVTQIMDSSGKIRDLDVLLLFLKKVLSSRIPDNARPGILRLSLRVTQSRDKLMPGMIVELEKSNFEKYANRVEKIFSKSQLDETADRIETKLAIKKSFIKFVEKCNNTTNRYYALVIDENNIDELHDYRKEVKKQRYTLEFFNSQFRFSLGKEITKLKSYQETLGFIHDADVWQILFEDFLKKEAKRTQKYFGNTANMKEVLPGINYLETTLRKQRGIEYKQFVKNFQEELGKDFWVNIYNSVL